jgi:serine/threonine protein kinase
MMVERFLSGAPKPRRPAPLPDDLASGRVIAGIYTLRRLIGRGGVGDVYLATEAAHAGQPERDVVVKLLAGRWMGDVDAVARFERETKRLRSLEHPNIVSMFDAGVDHGRPYLVTEWVDGELLGDYANRLGRLGMKEFVPIAAQILKGVGHAHSREMMIRDIKPSNIMLCERKGRANFVKVLDFGLAKFMRNEAPLTEGYVLGTAGYLAPEAILGGALDLRVDVYALGVLFYRLLAGVTPFDGCEDATIFYKTINDRPRDLHDLLPDGHDVPDALVGLIHDCLAKDVADRPADANIVVERLIDAVPANFFRLPSLTPTGQTAVATGPRSVVGNTGLIQLLDRSAPRPAANVAPTPMSIATAGPARTRARIAGWAGVIAVACVVSAATAWGLGGGRGPAAAEPTIERDLAQASLGPGADAAPIVAPTATPPSTSPAPAPVVAPPPPTIPVPVAIAVPVVAEEPASGGRARRTSAPRPRPAAPAPTAAAPTGPQPAVAIASASAAEPAPAPERKSVFLSADRPVAADRSLLPAGPRTP